MNLLHVSIREHQLPVAVLAAFVVMFLISLTSLRKKGSAKTQVKKLGWNGMIAVHYVGQEKEDYTRYIVGSHEIPAYAQIEWIMLPGASYCNPAIMERCTLFETTKIRTSQVFPYTMVFVERSIRGLKYEFPYLISCTESPDRIWSLHIHVRDSMGLSQFYLNFSASEVKAQ